ncbi:MAG: protein kinase [Myxococcales bacterium]|nr:protein kinase [Myxococcales bacterium]
MTDAQAATHDPFTSSLAGRRLGRYEVLARLASGGMAGVYVARAQGVAGFERLFAIKVLHPHLAHEEEFITMFLDEARLAARIRHPNVVPTIDISDTPDAGYFLVMDYIEGDHLGAVLQAAFKAGSKLPAPVSLRIVVDALDGLAAAHNLKDEHGNRINLVHRDISPHNIMVSTGGIARITDFGVAKAEVRLSTTREGQFKGKLAYMAPEHASSGDADQRSDLFAMAIILWECLAGRRLFRAENHAATLNMICIEPIPMPSSVDPALAPFDPVLQRGLARDPGDRYQSAEEFAEAIEQTAGALGGLAPQREVAKLVRAYAAEKIERDEQLIRSAIAEISKSGGGGMDDTEAAMAAIRAQTAAPAVTIPPPVVPPPPAGANMEPGAAAPAAADAKASKKWPMITLGALAAITLAVGVAALMMEPEAQDITSAPLDAPAAAEAPFGEPPPAELEQPTLAEAPTEQAAADAATEAQGGAGAEVQAANAEPTATEEQPSTDSETQPEAESAETKTKETRRRASRSSRRSTAKSGSPKASSAAKSTPKTGSTKTKRSGKRVDDLLVNPYRK